MEILNKCRHNYWTKLENIVAEGEIARFEQFLILSQCFQKSSAADASKCVYMWERVNKIPRKDASWSLLQQTLLENNVTKREIAQKGAISPLAPMFSTRFNNYTLFDRDFPHLCKYVIKVVCCRLLYVGKG